MCRLLAFAAERPLTLAEVLGEETLSSFLALSHLHRDGWGMAWLTERGRVATRKAPVPAHEDPRVPALACTVATTGLFLHLRLATPGLPVGRENTHPFTDGDRLAFAHNGALRSRGRPAALVPPALAGRRRGTADSERYFLRFLDDAEAHGIAGGLCRAAAAAEAVGHPTSLNAVVLATDAPALAALSWHDPARGPLRPTPEGGEEPDLDYFRLRWRREGEATVVASTGWPQRGWQALPDQSLLLARPGDSGVRVLDAKALLGAVPDARAGDG